MFFIEVLDPWSSQMHSSWSNEEKAIVVDHVFYLVNNVWMSNDVWFKDC